MGGLNPGIPLAVRPPSEPQGPLDMAGGAMQLSALAQQQQLRNQQLQAGELQLQEARQGQAEQQTMMQLMKKNQGDLDKTYEDAVRAGTVRPQTLQALQMHRLQYKTQLAQATEANLNNEMKAGDLFGGAIDVALTADTPERAKEILNQQIAKIANTGEDVSSMSKAVQSLPSFDKQNLENLKILNMGHAKHTAEEIARRNVAREELSAQAAMTRAEAEKQPTEASLALASAQGDATAEAALKRLDQSKLASRPPRDTSASTNSRSDKSYQYSSAQLDKVGQPIEQAIQRFGRLKDTINQQTPQADALVAPELLTVMAGGQGSGLRMNEAEIKRIVGGRSNLESLKAALNKWQLDPSKALSITPAQRKQVRDLMNEVQGKLLRKQEALDQARQDLVNEDDVFKQRMIVTGARNKLTKIDMGEDAAPAKEKAATHRYNPDTGEIEEIK